ncbi:MAG: protein-disulfide reductase DsbD domain-containing protein, partial [Bacteroidota bacterium]
MRIFSCFIFFLALFAQPIAAQIYNPVKWDMDYKQTSDQEFDLIFTATIEPGWSIYSQYLESDDGPVRTSFEFDAGAHYQLQGKNEESGNRKEAFDNLFDMNVIKFSKKAVFKQKVKVSDLSKPITGYLEFMTCDDTKCLPPDQVDFEFQLKSSAKSGATKSPEELPVDKIAEQAVPGQTSSETTAQAATKEASSESTNTPAPEQPAFKDVATSTPAAADQETPTAPIQEAPKYDASSAKSNSGILDPVQWGFSAKKINDSEYELLYTATIDPGWYIYSQFLEGDDGPEPTSFNFDESEHYSLLGKTEETGPQRSKEYDQFFDMNLIKFKKSATFTQRVKVEDPQKPIHGYLIFMCCEAGRCLPPTDVDFWLEPASLTALVGEDASAQMGNGNANTATTAFSGKVGWKLDGNLVDQQIATIQSTYENPVGDCGKEDNAKGQNIFITFMLGFIGGLFALLTPCVFPMIPLTVSYFTKGSKDRVTGIRNGLIYGLSIIIIYVSIGLLLTAVFGPEVLNELSTNWIANTLFFLIFIVFAFSFFGFYEITLPSSWANKSDAMADKGGLIGTFFMAFTLAIVSFSCTGPIIGSAIVQSASNAVGPFVVMLGFSTALALPFGLFAAFPAWLNSLPSSGGWMNSVKVVLGFIELALAFKVLSVADMTMHWGILGYEIFMGIWVLIAAAMTLYLFGFIKFPHDSPLNKLSPTRGAIAFASLVLTVYLASGFLYNEKTKSYNSLSLMSGLAPPAQYNYFLDQRLPNEAI